MYCSKCGTQIPDGAKFCPKCGQAAPNDSTTEEKPVSGGTPQSPQSQPTPQPQPVVTKKGHGCLYAGLGCAVVLVIFVAFGVWGAIIAKKKMDEELKNNPNYNQATITPKVNQNAQQPNSNNNSSTNLNSSDPKTVVTSYMQNTLGLIPNSNIDYDQAKQYLTTPLKARFDTPGFVPQTYCIQDGPEDVKIESFSLVGNEAVVTVSANYGGTWQTMWEFDLEKQGSEWLIDEIKCLAVN